ncbi:MAG: type II toxin-antitoxin system RelE/ParE family toxin [Cryomorphaceae bacterium]|nr:MAG: type II toxin-antitoxin system RelE/ParE family toxin [Cryomorphaceae bacterium]
MKTVSFSESAKQDLEFLLSYLEETWSVRVKYAFIDELDLALQTMAAFPDSFPSSAFKRGVRKCVVSKQTTLYYRTKKNEIEVIAIFDSRRDPGELKI